MKTVLFIQSEEPNPYELYKEMLLKTPVYRDEAANVTAIYSYADCSTILHCSTACVPPQNHAGLNGYALRIADQLARFRNIPNHGIAKKAACELYQQIQPVPMKQILTDLLNSRPIGQEVDWVKQVSRKLPVLTILKGFNFTSEDCEYVADAIGSLVKIMQHNKTGEMIRKINSVSKSCYQIIEKHILKTASLHVLVNDLVAEFSCSKEVALEIYAANLAGLMMQGYDACSGLLSNALLYFLSQRSNHNDLEKRDPGTLQKMITEVLRYDPPVHNTRRIATGNIMLNNTEINEGENLLLVLAAANRDEKQFQHANIFNAERHNNQSQLTFGSGIHACLASQFATNMATQTLHYFFSLFPRARLLSDHVEYEPIVNARLPVSLLISLT